MKHIQTTSVLVRSQQGDILLLVNKNKMEINSNVTILSEEYYKIGSPVLVNDHEHRIVDLQFIYRDNMGDCQTVITVA